MTIENLKEAVRLNKDKIKMLENWLMRNFENPYRVKVISDLNACRVELRTKEYNLEQLMAGLPSHGEELPMRSAEDKETNKYNK